VIFERLRKRARCIRSKTGTCDGLNGASMSETYIAIFGARLWVMHISGVVHVSEGILD
jgi:hypothetical protein